MEPTAAPIQTPSPPTPTPLKHHSNMMLMVGMGIVIVVIALVAYMLGVRRGRTTAIQSFVPFQSIAPTATPTPITQAQLAHYANSAFEYTFDYPALWQGTFTQDPDHPDQVLTTARGVTFSESGDKSTLLQEFHAGVSIFQLPNRPADVFTAARNKFTGTVTEVKVGTLDGLLFTNDATADQAGGQTLVVANSKYEAVVETGGITTDEEQKVSQQIIDSFRFLTE